MLPTFQRLIKTLCRISVVVELVMFMKALQTRSSACVRVCVCVFFPDINKTPSSLHLSHTHHRHNADLWMPFWIFHRQLLAKMQM